MAIVGHKLSHAVYATYSVQIRKGYASRLRDLAAVREEEAERAITTEVEHRRAQLAGLMAPFYMPQEEVVGPPADIPFARHLNAKKYPSPARERSNETV